jgi:hypothetical protein
MADIAEIVAQKRYEQGFTFESYLESIGDNQNRFMPHIFAFKLAPSDVEIFKKVIIKTGGLKVLAIGEDWCPDVHRGLPVMAKIAELSGMEFRFFPRDKNLDLINLFLKDGKYQSIPVFSFFNKDLKHLCDWIERPVAATKYQEEIIAQLAQQKLSGEDMRKAMQEKLAPLTESWRQETVREIKDLLIKST